MSDRKTENFGEVGWLQISDKFGIVVYFTFIEIVGLRERSIRTEVHQHFLEGGNKVLNLHKLSCR